jgi:kynurenine 3-monooxygenase
MPTPHVILVGNGLAGSFLAVVFARAGWRVSLYERRGDPRAKGYQGGRSINLALSARGLAALEFAGLADLVRERDLIPMPGRMIHPVAGPTVFQPYSHNPADAINSVSRGGLNLTLITAAATHPAVAMHFDHLCVDVDFAATTAAFQKPDGTRVTAAADLIVAADGAFSVVRGVMQKTDRFEYSQAYLAHGYKELHIPPETRPSGSVPDPRPQPTLPDGRVSGSSLDPHALHIWPRPGVGGGSMMIALPNRDGSFTCTLFWPFEGEHSFANLRTPGDVEAFFRAQYADAFPLMPTLTHDYFANPTSSLVTVRCWPWVRNRTVLLGDAAHAIVPFYGQGINCGFEDAVDLVQRLPGGTALRAGSLPDALDAYQHDRKPNADAIADMALDNFIEMRDKVGRPDFLYRKKIEQTLHAAFPDRCQPQYNLVSFSTVPYTEAKRRGDELARLIGRVVERLPLGTLDPADPAWKQRVIEHAQAEEPSTKPRHEILFDLSPVISPSLPVWPGDNPFAREVLLDTEKGAKITLSTIRTTVHLGSHADGSNHYATAAEGGVGIDAMPLDHYLGPCTVLQASGLYLSRRLTPADFPALASLRTPRVLLKTNTFPDPHRWNADFAALSVELIDALAARGVITIGVDTPSVDLQDSKDLPAHRAILRHRIAILEGLVLRDVPSGEYDLSAVPLKIKDADASPVRALLRTL